MLILFLFDVIPFAENDNVSVMQEICHVQINVENKFDTVNR